MTSRKSQQNNSILTITSATLVFFVVEVFGCSPVCDCTGSYYAYCDNKGITSQQITDIMKFIPQTVTYIDFSQNFLQTINKDMFTKHHSLLELDLHGNGMQEIQVGTFKPLVSLRKLYLNHNNLTEIGSGIFSNLSNLKVLHLNGNRINVLGRESFQSLTKLEELSLCDNAITQISPTVFQNVQSLVYLDLSGNQISNLEDNSFGKLSRLKTLILKRNLLSQLTPESFSGLTYLRKLDLQNNLLQQIRRVHLNPFIDNIEDINLCANLLQEIETDVFQEISSLKRLNLAHNHISWIRNDAFRLLQLDYMNLQGNKLTSISRGVFRQVIRIKELDLSNNDINEIMTGAFDSVRNNLYILDLSHNRLNHVRAGMIRGMVYLQFLDMSKNIIEDIDSGTFSDIQNLKLLNLESNQITSLYASGDQGLDKGVKSISLVNNPLHTFSGYVFSLPVTIYMNLTVTDVTESSVSITWPFKNGGQIYWTVQVYCHGNHSQCIGDFPRKKYEQISKTVSTVKELHTNTEYYICVTPSFVNPGTDIIQCSTVRTSEMNITSTSIPPTKLSHISSLSSSEFANIHFISAICIICIFYNSILKL